MGLSESSLKDFEQARGALALMSNLRLKEDASNDPVRQRQIQELYISIDRCSDVDAGRMATRIARLVRGVDIKHCQSVVLNRGTADHAVEFAHHVPGADVAVLQDKVLANGDAQAAYWFARHVKGASIDKLQSRVLQLADAQTALFFARDIAGADRLACERLVLKSGTTSHLVDFARSVELADVRALQERFEQLVRVEEVGLMASFATQVPGADVTKLYEALNSIAAGAHSPLIAFAARLAQGGRVNVSGRVAEVIDDIENRVIAREWAADCLAFAQSVNGAHVQALYASAASDGFKGLSPAKRKLFARLAHTHAGHDMYEMTDLSPSSV